MFSSIKISSREDVKQELSTSNHAPISVFIAASRPLVHLRGPSMPPITFPTISLHVDRHKIVTSLQSCGAEMEITNVPEFTKNAIATAMDLEERTPDVVFLCGTGTSWDNLKIITEDGFGSADFVDMQTLKLVVPQRPKLLIAVGPFCDEFGTTASELGVSACVLVLDDSLPPGASDAYELISMLFKDLVRVNGSEEVVTVVQRAIATMEQQRPGSTGTYARVYSALRAVAPPQKLVCSLGACRVKDADASAAIRARQNPRVFRLRSFDGRSQTMWDIIDAFERKCSHNVVILHGGPGVGRTELAAQLMLWFLDRSRLTCGVFSNCHCQSDVAHYVYDANSFYDLCGALLNLGMAGRQASDTRRDVLIRALKAVRGLFVFDDWHCLTKEAQRNISGLVQLFPPGARIVVTCRGAAASDEVRQCQALFPGALSVHVGGVDNAVAERMFFVHMERCKYGLQHASYLAYENPYHRSGKCSQLGNPPLERDSALMLRQLCSGHLGVDGTAHAQAALMLAASAAYSQGGIQDTVTRFLAHQSRDYGAVSDTRYGSAGSMADVEPEVLWPAMCVAHQVLTPRHHSILAILMQLAVPVSVQEVAQVSGETPQAVESMSTMLVDLRLAWFTPARLLYVLAGARDCINNHIHRRVGRAQVGSGLALEDAQEEDVMRAEDFYAEPWVAASTDSPHVQVLQKMCKHFSNTEGAWAQVVCAKHMLLCVRVMGVDLNEGATEGSVTLLYEAYSTLVRRWYMEWDRGGIAPPGAYEACLDGRHGACRHIPAHYSALRDLLLDIANLARERDRQAAACQVLSDMLFAIGDYDFSKKLLSYHALIKNPAKTAHR